MSGAPQANAVNGSLQYVNTGEEQVYNKALDAGLFDYMLVQDYNTADNWIDSDGNLLPKHSPEGATELDPDFMYNSYMALKKITPKSTQIVIGEPATAAAAGAGTIFHGPAEDAPYKAMCEQYAKLSKVGGNYGGAMTWEIVVDSKNNYSFANAFHAGNKGNCEDVE